MLTTEKVEECINALKRDYDVANKNLAAAAEAYLKLFVQSRYFNVRKKGVHHKRVHFQCFKAKHCYRVETTNDEDIVFDGVECNFAVLASGGTRLRLPFGTSWISSETEDQLHRSFSWRFFEKEGVDPLKIASASSEANGKLLEWKARVDNFAVAVKKFALMLEDIEAFISKLEREADAIEAKRDASILSAFGVAVETKKPSVNRFTVTVTENGGAE